VNVGRYVVGIFKHCPGENFWGRDAIAEILFENSFGHRRTTRKPCIETGSSTVQWAEPTQKSEKSKYFKKNGGRNSQNCALDI
jgi:hypothetical protein